ncbi:hypothetical protein BGZ65_005663 [Modicella reniformis]|uniref:F-box domain-containing protein n=1 Tax=Modicella reniformis TaxID=1440133 RepID=A0A9P6MGU4_9FUNG|nr:hypothetical protein BGZ65_005663 [Modicella reniformis]
MEPNRVVTLPQLPSEVLSVIFQYLSLPDILCCLTVSREWHVEAAPYLYSNAKFLKGTCPSLIQRFKANKHYIHHLEWDALSPKVISEEDILDILLDYHASGPIEDLDDDVVLKPGSRRATLYSFRFSGTLDSVSRFDEILFNLTSLTRLSLYWWAYSREVKGNIISLDRILETMPHLIHLSVEGCDFEPLKPESPLLDQHAPMYRLQTFCFDASLIDCQESILRIFRRLGHLVAISVYGDKYNATNFVSGFQPQRVGLALQTFCPKLEQIHASGYIPFYFYLFPTSTSLSPIKLHGNDQQEHSLLEEQRRQQCEEAFELFPKLKSFSTDHCCILAVEDLRALGVCARFLTHLTLSGMIKPAYNVPLSEQQDDGRVQRRCNITTMDLQIFLETCQHLQQFSAPRMAISLEDMTPSGMAISRKRRTYGNNLIRLAKPWACEQTLEKLEIGFEVASTHPSDHRIVFAQLGRCRRLKSLSLRFSDLMPTLTHGVDLLVGLEDTLEEIPSWSSAWSCDNKETLLWLLTRFKKLTKIGTNIYEGSGLQAQVMGWLSPEQCARLSYNTKRILISEI